MTLTEQQLHAIALLANPFEDLSNPEVCERVGVSESTFYRWKRTDEFLDRLTEEVERGFKSLRAKAITKLNLKLDDGEYKAIELVLTKRLNYTHTQTDIEKLASALGIDLEKASDELATIMARQRHSATDNPEST